MLKDKRPDKNTFRNECKEVADQLDFIGARMLESLAL